jgi:hypothetical protein
VEIGDGLRVEPQGRACAYQKRTERFADVCQQGHALLGEFGGRSSGWGRTIKLMESLILSNGVQMGVALIAATAIAHQLPVLTANVKRFSAVAGLKVEAFSP